MRFFQCFFEFCCDVFGVFVAVWRWVACFVVVDTDDDIALFPVASVAGDVVA